MKTSEITKEANDILKIFKVALSSDDKATWKKAIDFIKSQIDLYSMIWWKNKFIWQKVLVIVTNRFWKKFIWKEFI